MYGNLISLLFLRHFFLPRAFRPSPIRLIPPAVVLKGLQSLPCLLGKTNRTNCKRHAFISSILPEPHPLLAGIGGGAGLPATLRVRSTGREGKPRKARNRWHGFFFRACNAKEEVRSKKRRKLFKCRNHRLFVFSVDYALNVVCSDAGYKRRKGKDSYKVWYHH